MLNTLAKTILSLIVAFLLLWQLPWLVNLVTASSTHTKFTLYSSLANDFIVKEHPEGEGVRVTGALTGKTYTEAEGDSLLPLFFTSVLVSHGRMPDTVLGHAVTPHQIRQTNFNMRISPRDINANNVQLYQLLESLPKRVDLEMPDDVFRFSDNGIEFIKMENNQIKPEKSQRFTQALKEKGFQFPVLDASGNPIVKKPYDEGYLLLDANHRLFQLKRCAGRPFVREFEVPDSITLAHVFILEPTARQLRGLAVDTDHYVYVLTPDYRLVRTGIDSYKPKEESLMIIGNLIDWTASVITSDTIRYYALDGTDYHKLNTYCCPLEKGFTLPGLHFTSDNDKFCYPRF